MVFPAALAAHRELDLLALADDTPRLLGVRLGSTLLLVLVGAVLLAATAVSAIGIVGFVGLVAPHAARALVGSHHRRVLPTAALLGAALVSIADTVGRTVIAPGQIRQGCSPRSSARRTSSGCCGGRARRRCGDPPPHHDPVHPLATVTSCARTHSHALATLGGVP